MWKLVYKSQVWFSAVEVNTLRSRIREAVLLLKVQSQQQPEPLTVIFPFDIKHLLLMRLKLRGLKNIKTRLALLYSEKPYVNDTETVPRCWVIKHRQSGFCVGFMLLWVISQENAHLSLWGPVRLAYCHLEWPCHSHWADLWIISHSIPQCYHYHY